MDKKKFIFIAGPCIIENKQKTLAIASQLCDIAAKLEVAFVFKASFDKANRTSVKSFRGPGLSAGIKILEEVKRKFKVPVLSDVHCRHQVKVLSDVLDVIQIPAFLCRQTDLIVAVAKTKKTVNIKKGQFLAPQDIKYIIEKVESAGNKNILITERGASFGYNNLVVDFRSFLIMKEFGYPIMYDATHSLQRPSAGKGVSGGDRAFIGPIASAAVACGVDGVFMEVHPDPARALSDASTSYPLTQVHTLLEKLLAIRQVAV
ncbi:MAG: 3-deoxy-8-phosphooctulonate synthase [Candidatus Omnitrophota bacterium]